VPAPPRPAQPALGTIVRTTFVNPGVADTRCPPPDMSSLNGSPPPSSRRDTTQFNYDMYEWLERRQHRDVRRQQYWARAQAMGSAPVVFHDWDVINDQPVQVALSPQHLHTNQPRQQGARPMAVTGHWGPRQYTAAQVGRGHRRRRPNHRKSRSGGHQFMSTERPSDPTPNAIPGVIMGRVAARCEQSSTLLPTSAPAATVPFELCRHAVPVCNLTASATGPSSPVGETVRLPSQLKQSSPIASVVQAVVRPVQSSSSPINTTNNSETLRSGTTNETLPRETLIVSSDSETDDVGDLDALLDIDF
jgi:hypothetical protein